MAYKRSLLNRTPDDILEIFEEALTYAGGEFSSRLKAFKYNWNTDYPEWCYFGFCDKGVEDPDNTNYIIAFAAAQGAYGYLCARSRDTNSENDRFYVQTRYNDNVLDIIATQYGIFIIKSVDATSVSVVILSIDNHNEFVSVVSADPLSNPVVVPRNEAYTSAISYPASKSTLFGCTSLSYIPVPTYDGQPHYLPNLAYANATQYVMNGPVMMGNKIWYCIGGAFYLYEGENDS